MFIGKAQLAVDRDFVRVEIYNAIESSRLQTVLSISEFDYYPLIQIMSDLPKRHNLRT